MTTTQAKIIEQKQLPSELPRRNDPFYDVNQESFFTQQTTICSMGSSLYLDNHGPA